MRWKSSNVALFTAATTLLLSVALPQGVAAVGATPCVFSPGFASLATAMPDAVATCTEDEYVNSLNGNTEQHTTTGLLYWRKSDGTTAFTDGYRTWLLGPYGLQDRLNGSLPFGWEKLDLASVPADITLSPVINIQVLNPPDTEPIVKGTVTNAITPSASPTPLTPHDTVTQPSDPGWVGSSTTFNTHTLDTPSRPDEIRTVVTGTTLRNVNLGGATMRAYDFSGADMSYAKMGGGDFTGSNFSNANMAYVTAAKAIFFQANFTPVNTEYASFTQSDFRQASLINGTFSADFSGSDFRDADLRCADLRRSNLNGAVFNHGTQVAGARLLGVRFNGRCPV